MKLSGFDLNHVRALHFLLEEAHVARAARRLAITPAAASNALHRLRRDFNDPLLVRVGRTFARSALGEQLRVRAAEVIASAERLVDAAVPFEPKTDTGSFVLSATDRIVEVLLKPLDQLLTKQAPHANLYVRAMSGPFAPPRADERGLFIAPATAHRVRGEALFTEEYVCILRRDHPLLKGRFSLQRFAAAEHILVAPVGASNRGVVDSALEEHGLSRRVSRVVTSFSLALSLVESSNRIATLPSSFAIARSKLQEIVIRKPPVKLAPIEMQIAWHPQQEGDPRYTWFRGVIRDSARVAGLNVR